MTTTPGRVVVAGMARQYLAPVGSTFPTTAAAALDAAFIEVGLFTPDSLKFATDPNFEEILAHQSAYPVRTIQTTDKATLEVDLLEWSAPSFMSAFGGGSITEITPGVQFKYSPPAIGGRLEKASISEIVDGTKTYRLCIPRCQQQQGATLDLKRTGPATLPLQMKVLGGDVGDPWYLLTNDTAFDESPTAPTITGVTPATGVAAGGTQIMISGTGFVAPATATVGAVAVTGLVVASTTAIVCITPAHAVGAVAVAVTTGGGTASSAGAFTYT